WQMLAEEKGAKIRVVPIDDAGEFLLDEYRKLLTPKTKLVAVTQVSNALGTVTPLRDIIRLAHDQGAKVLVDGAQAVAHQAVDVRGMDCDFYVFSAHKLYGPTGVGVLYGKLALLNAMPPYQGGGDMIATVTFEKTTYKKAPYKFEAGTPNIAGGVALTAALDYVTALGFEAIEAQERDLLAYGTERLSRVPGLRIIGTAREKAGVISFTLGEVHPHDIGTILDRQGVAIRAGHHCAQPVMDRFGVPATARASFALYNTREEVDALEAAVRKVMEVFG
ncbi:MAG TPA: cysteine desulfurase, partial [bacterium]|nr:cysteine desulfurase [bacterium]